MWTMCIVAFFSIVLWEVLPLRKWYYTFKIRRLGAVTRVKLFYLLKIIRRYERLLWIAIDFTAFYFLFLWRQGMAFGKVVSFLLFALDWLWHLVVIALEETVRFLFFVTPFQRDMMSNEQFCRMFIFCTIYAGLESLISLFGAFVTGEKHKLLKTLVTIVLFISMLNILYYICTFIIQISWPFPILGFIAAFVASVILWLLCLIPYITIVNALG